MLIYSSNLKEYDVKFNKEAIMRINIAWVKTYSELKNILEENKDKNIFLDYPKGRSKPPKPILMLLEVLILVRSYQNIKYFAISNAESKNSIRLLRKKVPGHIQLVPKIESIKGIKNLLSICKEGKSQIVMLDKEDLYIDLDKNNIKFNYWIKTIRDICRENQITLLELQGVIFEKSKNV